MKFDLENGYKPRMCFFNVPYDDGGYSGGYDSGKRSGYEHRPKRNSKKN